MTAPPNSAASPAPPPAADPRDMPPDVTAAASRHIARIVVNATLYRQASTFDYLVPPDLAVEPGHLVWVPFGRQRAQGIVFEVGGEAEVAAEALRPIEALIDPAPAL